MAEHCRQVTTVALALGLACAASAQDTPFILGVNGHPFQQEAYWHVPLEAQLALVKEAGLRWYRTDWGWADFERSDQLVAAAEVAGVKLLPILFPDVSAANGDVREVRRLAFEHGKAIAERYRGRISHYELSNELECQVMSKAPGGGDRDGAARSDYDFHRYIVACELLRGLAEGVHEGDPEAKRIINCAGWLHFGFIDRLVDDGVPFDIVAWHWYSDMGDITTPKESYSGTWDVIAKLKSYGKEIWLTECNRRNGDMDGTGQEQADYLADQIRKVRATGVVKAFFVYELLDEPYFEGGEGHYGLVEVQKQGDKWAIGPRKPAFEVVRLLAAQ